MDNLRAFHREQYLITDLVYESDARGQDQAGQPTLQEGTPSNTDHRSRNSYIRESKAFYDEKFERKKSLWKNQEAW